MDSIVVIRPTDGKLVGKHVARGPDGKLKKTMFSGARSEWWQGTEIPVDSIYDLHRVIESLRSKSDRCVIRGAPLPGVDISRAHKRRTKHSRKDTNPPAYQDVGRRWMGIDIDNLPYDPEEFDPYGEPEEFFEWLCATISEDLEDVSLVYQFSTGAGIQEEGKRHNIIKVHLWFWLDRPYTCSEIKRWCQGINVAFEANLPAKPGEKVVQLIDTTPLQPVGILYTADPILEGVSSAVIRRVGLVDLGKEHATLKIPEGRQGSIAINSPLRLGRPVNAGLDLEDRLAMIGDGPGQMGFHPGFISVVGYYFWKHGAGADPDYIKGRIIDAALAREDDRPPGEVRSRLERLDDIVASIQGNQAFKEETGAFVREDEKPGPRETDLSRPYYPYPDIPNPIEGTGRQNKVIGAWFGEAIKRAALRRIELDGGEAPEIEIDEGVPNRLQITGPVGSGKTSTVERIIRESADAVLAGIEDAEEVSLNVYVASGLTDKAAETAEEIPGAIVLRGVAAPDPDLEDKAMCWRSDMASQVQASQGVLSAICRTCPFARECGYKKQAERVRELEDKPGVRVFTGPHEFLHYPSQVRGGWDIVVVDERYKAEGAKSVRPVRDIATGFDFSGYVFSPEKIEGDDSVVDERGRIKVDLDPELVNNAIVSVRRAIKGNEHRILGAIRDMKIAGRIENLDLKLARRIATFLDYAFENTKPFDEGGNPKFNARARDEEIIELISEATDSRLAFVARFFEALVDEWEAPREQSNTIRIEGGRLVLRGYKAPTKVPPRSPVLLLDATAKLHLNRKIWGADLEEAKINIENRVSATQVIRQSWTKASFLDESKGSWKLDEVARVINRYPHSFLAAPKAVREAIEPKLGETILTGHYANLRGLNAFSACKTGFVLCDPMVPPIAVLDLALSYGARDDVAYELPEYVDEIRRFRMRDPEEVETAICKVAESPVMEMYREILVDDEMLQAIGRVRGFWNERTVFILSNRPYDQTIDRVISWEEFLKGEANAKILTERSPNFIVDSPSWVVERFPDITKTPAIAATMLAQVREAGWAPSGWKAYKDRRNIFDVLSLSGQGSLLGPGNADLGAGWEYVTEEDEAVDPAKALFEAIKSEGWMPESPRAIIDRYGTKYGSEASIKRYLKRVKVFIKAYREYIISLSYELDPFTSPSNQTNSSPERGSTPLKPVFGRFSYRVEGQKRSSFGIYFAPNFGSIENRIRRELPGLASLFEVDLGEDDNAKAETMIRRTEQVAGQIAVVDERQPEVEATIRNVAPAIFEAIDGRETISVEEAIRRREERAAEFEARKLEEEMNADLAEEAIGEEADAGKAESFFDLTTAFSK